MTPSEKAVAAGITVRSQTGVATQPMRPQRRFKSETRDHLSSIAPFDRISAETVRDEMQEPTENDFTDGRRLCVSRQTGFARELRPRRILKNLTTDTIRYRLKMIARFDHEQSEICNAELMQKI